MIAVQALSDRIRFELDAEGSDRYLFDQDIKPAINSSIEWLVSVFNYSFERNKLSGEALTDLLKSSVYVASKQSRIQYDSSVVWSIMNVIPKPRVFPLSSIPQALPDDVSSITQPNVSFLGSDFSCHKSTLDKWYVNRNNAFEDGNTVLSSSEFNTFSYINAVDYSNPLNYAQTPQIEIRPSVAAEFVVLIYLKKPTQVNLITDNVEFPETLFNLIVEKASNFITRKQGDGTNLYTITEQEVGRLIQIMS